MELRCLECIPDWCVECPVLAARLKRCQCGNERRRETRSVVALSDVAIVAVRRLQQKLRNHFFGRGKDTSLRRLPGAVVELKHPL